MASRRTIKRRLLTEAGRQAGPFDPATGVGIRGASVGDDLQFGVGGGGELQLTGGLLEAGPDRGALDILEQLRQESFGGDLGRLESRLIGQGRLGLGTGALGANPELAGFFGANQRGQLQDRLAAFGIKQQRLQTLLPGLFGAMGFGERLSNRIGDQRINAIMQTAGQRGGGFGRGLLSAAAPIAGAFLGGPAGGMLANKFFGGGAGNQVQGDQFTGTGFEGLLGAGTF